MSKEQAMEIALAIRTKWTERCRNDRALELPTFYIEQLEYFDAVASEIIAAAIAERVNAFDALLAVAKAADEKGWIKHPATEALNALDATHPGWREWEP